MDDPEQVDPWVAAAMVNANWDVLDRLTETTLRLTMGMKGRPMRTPWYGMGLPLFDQLVQRCMSTLMIIPYLDRANAPPDHHWDRPSILTLIRSVWYQFSVYQYFCGEEIDEKERSIRLAWLAVNDVVRRLAIQKATGLGQEHYQETIEIEAQRKADLRNDPVFKSLDAKTQGVLLRGREEPFKPTGYAGEVGLNKELAEMWWGILCDATHTGPLQYFDVANRWGTEPGARLAQEFLDVAHCLIICGKSLETAATSFLTNVQEAGLHKVMREIEFSWRRGRPQKIVLSTSTPGI